MARAVLVARTARVLAAELEPVPEAGAKRAAAVRAATPGQGLAVLAPRHSPA